MDFRECIGSFLLMSSLLLFVLIFPLSWTPQGKKLRLFFRIYRSTTLELEEKKFILSFFIAFLFVCSVLFLPLRGDVWARIFLLCISLIGSSLFIAGQYSVVRSLITEEGIRSEVRRNSKEFSSLRRVCRYARKFGYKDEGSFEKLSEFFFSHGLIIRFSENQKKYELFCGPPVRKPNTYRERFSSVGDLLRSETHEQN